MSFSKSEYMLKYQKAKVKLLEYDIPLEEYPQFPLNYRDLAFPTILTISEYAEAIIEDNQERQNELKKGLCFCSEFYDAAVESREQIIHDLDFLLSGATAYFFQDNYGSSMVLLSEISSESLPFDMRGALVEIFNLIFYGKRISFNDNPIIIAFEEFINTGVEGKLRKFLERNKQQAYLQESPLNAFFSDILYAVIKIAIENSARKLLPLYSELETNKWDDYLKQKNSIKMVWPAQKLIGEKGIMKGLNAIVQLPTGVGKTKSIEIIIRSMFLSNRGKVALIVAPLRALCNEITDDMKRAFSKNVSVNQFSELLEWDFEDIFNEKTSGTILICTPEKLQFIFHHQPGFIAEIDLLIFDEGHLFDDMSRGAMYELLIADVKRNLSETQQIILLSAVLSNAGKILEWLTSNNGALAFDEKIKSTPKVIGFTSGENEIHYFSDTFSEEDFYIPRAIHHEELKSKRANCKVKYFPEDNSQDIALYYANQLCKNGGVAIYVNQRRSIPKILKRIMEIEDREYDLSRLREASNQDEMVRLKKLISAYYGNDYVYTRAALIGILPHYSTLPNGLRLAIEYAFRKGKIKVVVCTSTLAQGINIPIKYMVMTSLRSAREMLSTRNFQNLIGRTARSGVYTEGSIIISDTKLYDQRKKGKGYYTWQDTVKMFDSKNAEACGSAILSIVQDFPVDYEWNILGEFVSDFISKHISEKWEQLIVPLLISDLKRQGNQNIKQSKQVILERMKKYQKIIGAIENEICYVLVSEEAKDKFDLDAAKKASEKVYQSTLANFLANEQEKVRLNKIFEAIANDITLQHINIRKFANSMVGIDIAEKISELIEIHNLNQDIYSHNELIELVVGLYNSVYEDDSIQVTLCTSWIEGKAYDELSELCDISIVDVEKKCGQSVSYQLSFLIGNIIDFLDAESVNLDKLMILQKEVKYGVDSLTAISICEKIFNDRFLANKMVKVLGNKVIKEDDILGVVKLHKEKVLQSLEGYPLYFQDRLKYIK